MIVFLLLAGAALTWYIDKTYDGAKVVYNNNGDKIERAKNGTYPGLETGKQLAKNMPDISRSRRIGDWTTTHNPNPLIDVQRGGENVRVTDNKRQPVLPNQKQRFSRLVHQRENLEEYWRFDQYLGGQYQDQRPTERRSTIAYRYNS